MQGDNNLFQVTGNKQLKSKPLLLREEREGDDMKEVGSYIRLFLTSYLVTYTLTKIVKYCPQIFVWNSLIPARDTMRVSED